jgi:hypothetical protein
MVGKNFWWRKFEEIVVVNLNSLRALEMIRMIMIMIMVDYSKLPTSCFCVRTLAYFHQYNGIQPYDANDKFGRFILV